MFYNLKKHIILKNIKKRQSAGYDAIADELYELSGDAGANINNSYFFTAHTMTGETLYVRLGLRGDGSREVWVGWYDGDIFLENDRELYLNGEPCPLAVECIQPEKEWKISYSGTMRDVKTENRRTYTAVLNAVFTATSGIFDFFYDNDPNTTAHAIASEKWSKKLFSEISANNQRHYEQCGRVEGTLVINGSAHELKLLAARDHSFGPRSWSYMDRHFWLLAVDDNGGCLNISMVGYPSVSEIWTGYTTMFGGVDTIFSIKCDTKLSKAGHESGMVDMQVELTNGRRFFLSTVRDAEAIYRFDDGTYYFSEGIGHFVIDGRPARGTIEFSFNGDEARWRDK